MRGGAVVSAPPAPTSGLPLLTTAHCNLPLPEPDGVVLGGVAARSSRTDPSIRARTYCPASAASAISASAAMIAKPRARKMLPADATTLAVPTTGAIPIMIA